MFNLSDFKWGARARKVLEIQGADALYHISENPTHYGKNNSALATELLTGNTSKSEEDMASFYTPDVVQGLLLRAAQNDQTAIEEIKLNRSAISNIWGQLSQTQEQQLAKIWN